MWIASLVVVYCIAAVAVLWAERVADAAPPPVQRAPSDLETTPRAAGQKGLDWLLGNAVAWQDNAHCYGCHVQSFAVMGAAAAKANDYTVNLAQTRKLIDYLATIQDRSGYITAGQGDVAPIVQTVLVGIGLSRYDTEIGDEYGPMLVRMADWLIGQQQREGYWPVDHLEAPVDQGEVMTTAGAILTLAAAQRHQPDPTYTAAIQRGVDWLRDANPTTTQDLVYAVIGLTGAGIPVTDASVTQQMEILRTRQNSDGGWGEAIRLGSNGYATGQALYAYKAAAVDIADPSFRQGVMWLLEHQLGDGSWQQINSQQTSPGRASNYATTMWAVIGLGEVFDVATEQAFLSLIHPSTEKQARPGLGALLAFLLLPLMMVGIVWWGRNGRQSLTLRRERRNYRK